MKTRKFIIAMMMCLILLLVFAVGLVACNPDGGTQQGSADVYYLSLKSTGFKTYGSAADIPAGVLLTDRDGKYSVSIALDKDEEFTVNKVGSDDKLGYSAIFSTAVQLVQGEGNNIKVAFDGNYVITLSEGSITYAFTAGVSQVQIVAPAAVLEVGSTHQFAATVTMTDGSVTDAVSWSSSDAQVASVSESGLVTAVAVGNATIKATSTADPTKFAEYAVEVKLGVVNVQSVTVTPEEVLLDEGETTTLTAQISPDNATDKLVIWESDDQDVATVEGGVVRAVAPGIAHITVRTRDGGKEATATVTVRQPVTGIVVSSTAIKVAVDGNERKVRPILFPNDATNRKITATVDANSNSKLSVKLVEDDTAVSIKGLETGSATVTVSSVDDPNVKYTFNVIVVGKGTRLAWTMGNFNVNVGAQHTVELVFDNADVQSVTWSGEPNVEVSGHSENSKYTATVTGVQMGNAKVTAVVNYTDGTNETVTCTAYVTEDFFFIYGTGLDEMGADWDYETYISDRNKARQDGRLLEQKTINTYTLERKLTPEMGFQIIFPTIASDWERAIKYPSVYYNAARSDDKYVANTQDQFKVNTAGIYAITVTLDGYSDTNAQYYVTIKLVTLDITSVELNIGVGQRTVLKEGEYTVVQLDILPDEIETSPDEYEWKVSVEAEDAKIDDEYITIPSVGAEIEYYLNSAGTAMTVSVIKAEHNFDLTIECVVRGVKGVMIIPILSKDEVIVPVSEIHFEKDEYLINVNNGGADWATTVKAKVNDDATVQGVVYSLSDANAKIDRISGAFSASKFGVYTITATALGDTTYTDTVTVKVYSDTFYLTGVVNGVLGWNSPEVLSQVATSLEGTAFEQYKFVDSGDHVHFTLRAEFNTDDVFQILYLGMDENWTGAMTYLNYDEEGSIGGSIYETNLQTTIAGEYEITIDISKSTPSGVSPLVTIICIQDYPYKLDIKRIGASTMLKMGDTFRLQVSNKGRYYYNLYQIEVQEGYEDYVDVTIDYPTLTVQGTVKKAPESGILEFDIYVKLFTLQASVKVVICAEGAQIVAPKTLTFDEEHYYFNVNNGGKAWQIAVHATVDDDATDKRVSYKLVGAPSTAEIGFETGLVTSSKLGTFTVVATSLAATSVTAETLVTFYSDTMYLIGEIGDLQTYTTLPPTTTSLAGTGVYERYAFTMVDQTHFYLERVLDRLKLKAGNYDDYEYGFQIAYLGVDSMSEGVIQLNCYNAAGSYQASTYLAPRDRSMRVKVTGLYRVEVSLEGASPKYTVNFKELAEQEVKMDTNSSTTLKDGEQIATTLKVMPSWVVPEENKFSFEAVDAEGNSLSEYIGFSFDFGAMKLTANVKKVPLTGDLSVILRVKYGDAKGEINVTLIGTHHMAMTSDDTYHWMQCVDCDYTEGGKVAHTGGDLKYYDGSTHYRQCSVCGLRYEVGEHFTLDAEGYHDGTHLTCECGFRLYDIDSSGTIIKYYGSYGKLKIPNEINGVKVTGIGYEVFAGMGFITDVVLCDTIDHIDVDAFRSTSLESVVVKANVTYKNGAYSYLQNHTTNKYTKVTIEDGVTTIVASMFEASNIDFDFSELKNVVTIGKYAFCNTWVRGLTVLKLPEGIQSIGAYAFASVSNMCELIVPDSCTSIGDHGFANNNNLRRVVFGTGMKNFPLNDRILDTASHHSNVASLIFKAKKIDTLDINILGTLHNVDNGGGVYPVDLREVYFGSSAEDTMNIIFCATGAKDGVLGSPYTSDGGKTTTKALSHKNALLYDYATHQKHMYYYSEVRPTEDVWEFAGAWHYDKDGNVQKWSDTPLDEGLELSNHSLKRNTSLV